VGWRIRGSSTCPLAADGGEKCRTIYVCISFLHAVVVVLVVSVIILIHFVVAIFSSRTYAQQVFSVRSDVRGVQKFKTKGLALQFCADWVCCSDVSSMLQ